MNQSTYPQRRSVSAAIVAAVAAFVAVGLLSTVAVSFQRGGAPLEQLVAAERACQQYTYVSEREGCMTAWVAARAARVASK